MKSILKYLRPEKFNMFIDDYLFLVLVAAQWVLIFFIFKMKG